MQFYGIDTDQKAAPIKDTKPLHKAATSDPKNTQIPAISKLPPPAPNPPNSNTKPQSRNLNARSQTLESLKAGRTRNGLSVIHSNSDHSKGIAKDSIGLLSKHHKGEYDSKNPYEESRIGAKKYSLGANAGINTALGATMGDHKDRNYTGEWS